MPSIYASGANVSLSYIAEVTCGVTPASPTMQLLRLNGFDINAKKGELRSEEVRPDRMVASLRHGMRSVDGTLPGEMILANADDWIEAAMAGTWDNTITAANDIGVTNPDQIVCSSNTLLTDGYRPGDIVTLGGLAASGENGDYLVTAAAAGALTVTTLDGSAINLTTEAENATPTLDLKGSRLDIGTTMRTFSVERRFTDINQYQVMRGIAVNTMDLSTQPDSIPTISFGVLGTDFDDFSGTAIDASPTAATTNEAMAPFTGGFYENGARMAYLTGLDLQVNNNRELGEVVGSTSSPAIFEGDAVVTGTVTAYFPDATLASKFINETTTSLYGRLVDPATSTDFIGFAMNRVKFKSADISPPRTGAVTVSLPFEAIIDPVTGVSLSMQRSNA